MQTPGLSKALGAYNKATASKVSYKPSNIKVTSTAGLQTAQRTTFTRGIGGSSIFVGARRGLNPYDRQSFRMNFNRNLYNYANANAGRINMRQMAPFGGMMGTGEMSAWEKAQMGMAIGMQAGTALGGLIKSIADLVKRTDNNNGGNNGGVNGGGDGPANNTGSINGGTQGSGNIGGTGNVGGTSGSSSAISDMQSANDAVSLRSAIDGANGDSTSSYTLKSFASSDKPSQSASGRGWGF